MTEAGSEISVGGEPQFSYYCTNRFLIAWISSQINDGGHPCFSALIAGLKILMITGFVADAVLRCYVRVLNATPRSTLATASVADAVRT